MEKTICSLILVAIATNAVSGTVSHMSRLGFGTGFGWGYGMDYHVPPMGLRFAGMGVGRTGFAFPVMPISLGFGYRPLSYNHYGSGFGSNYGYHPRGYSGGGYGYSNGLYNSGFGTRYRPYSGIDDWDLDGFD